MKSASNRLKWTMALGIVCGALFAAKGANAAECTNDIDCPGGGAVCGGDVCSWIDMVCKPAGTAVSPNTDGWCTNDTDCKCHGMGATCVSSVCTFTKPKSGGTGGSSGHTGGTSGGSGGASSGSGGASAGSGGASAGSGGASSGNDAGTTPAKDSGGCSISGSASSFGLGLLIALGTAIGFRRRRNRA